MAKPFFEEDWEKLTKEELSRARSKLSGFIEGIPEKDKVLREVRLEESSADKNVKARRAKHNRARRAEHLKPDGQRRARRAKLKIARRANHNRARWAKQIKPDG